MRQRYTCSMNMCPKMSFPELNSRFSNCIYIIKSYLSACIILTIGYKEVYFFQMRNFIDPL